jgi:hypothetical protein
MHHEWWDGRRRRAAEVGGGLALAWRSLSRRAWKETSVYGIVTVVVVEKEGGKKTWRW